MYLLCLLVLPLAGEHQGQVVHAAECGGMFGAQHLLYDSQCLSVSSFRLSVFPKYWIALSIIT